MAILTYEALRQNGFPGLTGTGEMAEISTYFYIKEPTDMNYNKKTIMDVDVAGKKILLRCDFNVPAG